MDLIDDLQAVDDYTFQAIAMENQWSDGLPVLAPTPERVKKMLRSVDADSQRSLGRVPPSGNSATLEAIAANAVMAGCEPKYLPVVVAAVSAVLDPMFNLQGIQATTHTASTFVLVNGPAGRELGFNSEGNALGPGTRANATTGRAVRLCMQNIGGARSPDLDRSTQGASTKFTYCAAENETANPWGPVHVERGWANEDSVVTVFGGEAQHNIEDHVSSTPEGILYMAASTIAGLGANNPYLMGEVVLLLGPEHARTIASAGWNRRDISAFLFENARNPVSELRRGGMWGMECWPSWFYALDEDCCLPVVEKPDDIISVVIGGAGKHSSCIHSWGHTRAVSRPILTTGLEHAFEKVQ